MPYPTLGRRLETRRNNFDFLRFLFASLVILSHSYVLLLPGGNAAEPGARLTGMRMDFGSLAVACFFAISGFLITQSWQRTPRLKDYLPKRALRIYPGWIAALLLCLLVIAPLLRHPHGFAWGKGGGTTSFLGQLALYHVGVAPDGTDKVLPGVGYINSSTWTIPFEIMCYGLVAGLGLLGLFRRRVFVLLLAFSLMICCAYPPLTQFFPAGPLGPSVDKLQLPYFGCLRSLPILTVYFLSGMVYYLYRDHIPHSPRLLALFTLLVALTLGRLPLAPLFFVILPTFGFYVLFYLAFLPVGNLSAWAKRGDLSYGVYLYAFPIQRVLISEQFHGYHLSPLTLFLAAWALACGAAALSWRFVERPFLKLKPKERPAEPFGVPAVSAPDAPVTPAPTAHAGPGG